MTPHKGSQEIDCPFSMPTGQKNHRQRAALQESGCLIPSYFSKRRRFMISKKLFYAIIEIKVG